MLPKIYYQFKTIRDYYLYKNKPTTQAGIEWREFMLIELSERLRQLRQDSSTDQSLLDNLDLE